MVLDPFLALLQINGAQYVCPKLFNLHLTLLVGKNEQALALFPPRRYPPLASLPSPPVRPAGEGGNEDLMLCSRGYIAARS